MKDIYSEIQKMNIEQLKKDFGKCIQKHRKAKGYTQQDLADILGITPKSVSCTERGETFPGYENIFRLAQVLDMSLDEFVFGCSRFNNTICISEINDMLTELSPQEQGMIIGILKAACESMLRRSSK